MTVTQTETTVSVVASDSATIAAVSSVVCAVATDFGSKCCEGIICRPYGFVHGGGCL